MKQEPLPKHVSKKLQRSLAHLSSTNFNDAHLLDEEDFVASLLENDLLSNYRLLDLDTKKRLSTFVQYLADDAILFAE